MLVDVDDVVVVVLVELDVTGGELPVAIDVPVEAEEDVEVTVDNKVFVLPVAGTTVGVLCVVPVMSVALGPDGDTEVELVSSLIPLDVWMVPV